MQRLVVAQDFRVSCCCESFICNCVRDNTCSVNYLFFSSKYYHLWSLPLENFQWHWGSLPSHGSLDFFQMRDRSLWYSRCPTTVGYLYTHYSGGTKTVSDVDLYVLDRFPNASALTTGNQIFPFSFFQGFRVRQNVNPILHQSNTIWVWLFLRSNIPENTVGFKGEARLRRKKLSTL